MFALNNLFQSKSWILLLFTTRNPGFYFKKTRRPVPEVRDVLTLQVFALNNLFTAGVLLLTARFHTAADPARKRSLARQAPTQQPSKGS